MMGKQTSAQTHTDSLRRLLAWTPRASSDRLRQRGRGRKPCQPRPTGAAEGTDEVTPADGQRQHKPDFPKTTRQAETDGFPWLLLLLCLHCLEAAPLFREGVSALKSLTRAQGFLTP
ncbi:hypothetical protein FQA47_024314 [Oryzias melastigma]|uniref:Uncharacterized protein n=1 Tax=Oryzias melastigma TaxID=30732 RepID=A0A834BR98_ORYME|nr:hypothetical protein FQA47_024314 [Oryzias melastigma]